MQWPSYFLSQSFEYKDSYSSHRLPSLCSVMRCNSAASSWSCTRAACGPSSLKLWFQGNIWISIINKTLGTTVGSSIQFRHETICFAILHSHGCRWPWISDNYLESIARNSASLILSWSNVLGMLPFNTRNTEAEQTWVDEQAVAVSKPVSSLREEENCRARCAPILHSATLSWSPTSGLRRNIFKFSIMIRFKLFCMPYYLEKTSFHFPEAVCPLCQMEEHTELGSTTPQNSNARIHS